MATGINPNNPRAHYGLGLAKLFGDDRDGAITEYGLLRALDPDLAGDPYDRIVSPEGAGEPTLLTGFRSEGCEAQLPARFVASRACE